MVSGIATARPHRALAEHIHRLHGAYAITEPQRRREAPVPGTALILALEHDWGSRRARMFQCSACAPSPAG